MAPVEPLGEHHDRSGFTSASEPLDRYFRLQAGQDVRRRVAACFVLTDADGCPMGYYTLASTSLVLSELPADVARRLPRYPMIPATLMGRLAVDTRFRGCRYGETLLLDAMARALRSEVASWAFVVDAKDDKAASFYRRYGFLELGKSSRRLYLPFTSIARLFAGSP